MSDWIEHDGTCCPVPVGTWVEVRQDDGKMDAFLIDGEHWHTDDPPGFYGNRWFWYSIHPSYQHERIIAYRLLRSRAADEMIERIRNLEPERELA